MGQPVAVEEKPSTRPGVIRFEANRNLTGMGHEHFANGAIVGERPSAELARRLFATGQVASVHVYMNQVTVDLEKGFGSEGLIDVVRDLYKYWKPGMAPPAFEDLVAPAEETPAAVASGGGEDAALSEAAKRVPAHLLERSRLAREKWKAENPG